jgi:two-component system, sensor histidine kinase and response regulator
MTVLIVDDERDIRDSLRDAFEDVGYKVEVAANGAEALAKLNEIGAPAVVILDLIMPVTSGNKVWERMQAMPHLASVPVIMITSDPARAPSSVLTIRKPLNLKLLLHTVEKCCGLP